MKVAFVGPYPLPGRPMAGGVGRVIDCLSEELIGRVDLSVIVPGADNDHVEARDGLTIHYLRRNRLPGFARYWREDAKAVAKTVEVIAPDIVHYHYASGIARYVRRPELITVHGILERDIREKSRNSRSGCLASGIIATLVARIEKWQRAKIGRAIVISPYMRKALPDLDQLHTYDIPNPVARPFVAGGPSVSSERERLLVAVQRIGPLKNTLGLLEVATRALTRDKQARLVICGSASDQGYFEQCCDLVRTAGLQERITFAGHQTTDQVIAWLDRACCYVTMTRQETAPMAVAEAQCRGAAVLGPDDFGFIYMIEPGHNGFFWPAGNLDEKADLICRALDHAWDRPAIIAAAREAYHPRRVADRTLAVYEEMTLQPLDPMFV